MLSAVEIFKFFVPDHLNATTIFLQLRHFLLDVFQEVRVGPIKSKLPCTDSTSCCDLLSQLD